MSTRPGGAGMQRYGNAHGDSGVRAYALSPDAIAVEFVSGEVYLYTADSAGPARIARMHALAQAGRGLSSYIARQVRDRYAARFPDRLRWRRATAHR